MFGGASRLREEIKNAAKVIDGSLYVILGSCEAAMVGDDLATMAREARDISLPVIFYPAAGFRGGAHSGYANLTKALIRQLPEIKPLITEKTKGLVNVLGILPKTDIFYKGDLTEIRRLLEVAGLEVNTFFGSEDGVDSLERLAQAEHTLVFSCWGLAPAEQLKEQYGIPYTLFDSFPLGLDDTRQFFTALSLSVKIDEEKTWIFLEKEERQYRYYLDSLADVYFTESLGKNIAIVGDTAAVKRIGPFLEHDLGAVSLTAVITDRYGREDEKQPLPAGLGARVFESADNGEIAEILKGSAAELILGSTLEAPVAHYIGIPHLIISAPNGGQVLLHKTYTGITGAYFLIEDYAGAILRHNAEKKGI